MGREVVQEKSYLVVAVFVSELLQILLELRDVDGVIEDHEVLLTFLL